MLFTSDGIALSGYRYNIGGGGAGVTTVDRAPKEFASDSAGLYFLRAAKDDGVPILTGFVNSAPPRFTTNGKACGGNLKPGMETAYAQYLAGVVKTLHDRDHITLQYVSPMNEPDNSFGDCGQEGMQVPVGSACGGGAGVGEGARDDRALREGDRRRDDGRRDPVDRGAAVARRAGHGAIRRGDRPSHLRLSQRRAPPAAPTDRRDSTDPPG